MPNLLIAPLHADLQRWANAEHTVSLTDTDSAYATLPAYARARFVLSNGTLWKAAARCVYRRDEVTAWALLQLVERYPTLPDFDIVLNCRDGPLMRRPRSRSSHAKVPLVLSYSTTDTHSEVAFPDYTLWGLPGKLKPWPQLRLDLLHRAQRPFARRKSQLIATGVINDYHTSLGVRARQAVRACASNWSGAVDRRLDIRYHSLYFQRFYSTEEHCAYKYILLSPGSHAVWLDHLKQKLLCGSLVILLEPPMSKRDRPRLFQYDVLTRLLTAGVHYLSVPLPDLPPGEYPPTGHKAGAKAAAAAQAQHRICELLSSAMDWAEAHQEEAAAIARRGKALVRDALSMEAIYGYMAETLTSASELLAYSPASAITANRTIARSPFGPSNFSAVPTDPEAFASWLRNDTSYLPTAKISEADWASAVLQYNYSTMGNEFAVSARWLEQKVRELKAANAKDEAERRAKAEAEREARLRARAARRGGGRGGGAGRGRRKGRRRQRSGDL